MRSMVIAGICVFAAAVPLRAQSDAHPLHFHGLVQTWFSADDSLNTFRIRRTELGVTGDITPKVHWKVQIDPSKAITVRRVLVDGELRDVGIDNGSVLQDAKLTFDVSPSFSVDVGQFKLPVGLEGLQSSSTLETVERGLLSSGIGKLADIRDIGVEGRVKLPANVVVRAAVFNGMGESVNGVDRNAQKAAFARLDFGPAFAPGLTLGSSFGWAIEGEDEHGHRSRAGAEVRYANTHLTLKSELLAGHEFGVERRGYYGLAAYKFARGLEAAARYDVWDPDLDAETSISTGRERDYVAGISYFISGNNAKIMLNYLHKTWDETVSPARNLVLVNMQAAF